MKKLLISLALLLVVPVSYALPVVQNTNHNTAGTYLSPVYNHGYSNVYNQNYYNRAMQTRQYERYVPVYEQVPYTRYFCMSNGFYYEYTEEQSDDNCFYQVVNQTRIKEYKKVKYHAPYYGNTYGSYGYYSM
ncbi:hypothetical protein HOJ01_03740 [bacterium]|jgi:hypothetical protein|nr:hypothetical protein [bacterium]MBT6293893.1 hypothetical protein [bacterium]